MSEASVVGRSARGIRVNGVNGVYRIFIRVGRKRRGSSGRRHVEQRPSALAAKFAYTLGNRRKRPRCEFWGFSGPGVGGNGEPAPFFTTTTIHYYLKKIKKIIIESLYGRCLG